jgi:hypothetical protein
MEKFWLNYQNGGNYVKEEIRYGYPFLSHIFLDFQRRVLNLTLICWDVSPFK